MVRSMLGLQVRTSRLSAPEEEGERVGLPRAGKDLSSWSILTSVVRGSCTFSLLPDRTQTAAIRSWGKTSRRAKQRAQTGEKLPRLCAVSGLRTAEVAQSGHLADHRARELSGVGQSPESKCRCHCNYRMLRKRAETTE